MKMYLNNDLEINKFAEVFLTFSEQQLQGFSYIKGGTLDNQTAVQAFVQELAGETHVYVYDFATLQLEAAEFKVVHETLAAQGTEIVFLNELANVTSSLLAECV